MPTPVPRPLILGHGEMGRALELLLRAHRPRIWQRHDGPAALQAAVGTSDVILFCTPATALAELAATIRPWLTPATFTVTIAKGLDDAGLTPVEALHNALGPGRYAALYGPMISEEIRAGKPAFAQCGSAEPHACARLGALFAGTALRLAPAADLTGLAWSAILKNVYALAFGMSDELGLGDNVRGFLAVAAAHEIDTAVRHHGGLAATVFHLAGLGDLITTATSRGSHHHELGRRLARGDTGELRGEGVHTLAMLRAHRRLETDALPLLRLVDNCVQDPPGTARRWRDYLDSTRTIGH